MTLTRDEAIDQHKAKLRAAHVARNGRKRILKNLKINEISMVDAPAGHTFAEAIVYPASNRVEKLADLPGMKAHRRNIMRSFRIDEISAVDKPAQAEAKAVLIKRAADDVADEVERFRKQFPDQPVSVAAREAMLDRVLAAIQKREARERQEATTMPSDLDQTDHEIRKAIADAQTSMDDAIAKRAPGTSRYTAMEAWRRSHPTEFRALQASPPAAPAPIAKRGENTVFFELLTDQIRKRDNCSRVEAMERARTENPSAFARLQAS